MKRGVVNNNNGEVEEACPEVPENSTILKAGWLVKDRKLARVYYVEPNLKLEWIVIEEAAVRHFGDNWYLDIKEFDDLEAMGFSFEKISLTIILKIINASIQPDMGDNTKLATTDPIFVQITAEVPPEINPKPIKAPIIE